MPSTPTTRRGAQSPFNKSGKTNRTPPPGQTVLDMFLKQPTETGDKKPDESPNPPTETTSTTKKTETINPPATPEATSTHERLCETIEAMAKIAQEHRNTRSDLKELIMNAQLLCGTLRRPETCNKDTQTISPAEETLNEWKKTIESCKTRADQVELLKKTWPSVAFQKTKTSGANITNDETPTRIIICSRGEVLEAHFKPLRDQIPSLNKLNPEQDTTEICTTDTINGEIENNRRLIIIQTPVETILSDDKILDTALELTSRLGTKSVDTEIAVSPGHFPVQPLRKALEIALAPHATTVTICGQSNSHGDKARKAKTDKRTDQIIIQPGEKMTYADLVKSMHQEIQPTALGVQVVTAKRNPAGELVLNVRGQRAETEALRTAISNRIPGAQTKLKSKLLTVHLYNLEEEVTADDIMDGLRRTFRHEDCGGIQVTSVRQTYSNTRNATVKMPDLLAKELTRKGGVQVGLVFAEAKIRESRPRCSRCWEEGHTRPQCTGIDKSHLCFNCQQEGHRRNDCPKPKQNA